MAIAKKMFYNENPLQARTFAAITAGTSARTKLPPEITKGSENVIISSNTLEETDTEQNLNMKQEQKEKTKMSKSRKSDASISPTKNGKKKKK